MLPPVGTIDVDRGVLAFALVVSVVSGVLFGTAPALASTRLDVARALRAGGRGSTADRGTMTPRNLLAVMQIALAVMLVVGAGLFARTLVALERVDRGYDPTQLLQFEVLLRGERYDSRAGEGAFYDELFARLRALPGVTGAAAVGSLPIYGGSSASLAIRGRLEEEGTLPEVGYVVASDDLFDVMRMPLLAGRRFDERVRSDGPPMVIVSESVARRYFPAGDAVGAQVRLGPDPSEPWADVIGVVADVRLGLAEEARPTVYVNVRQDAWGGAFVLVRTTGEPRALEAAVRRELRAIDPGVPMVHVTTLSEAVSERMLSQRVWAQLMSLFAIIALTIAGIGVYGVVAFGVSARARELGVRTALGARPRDVLLMVLAQGARLAGVGVLVGIAAAALGGRALATMLYGVQPLDAWTYAMAALVIASIALVASWVPARRATRVDPLTVLRAE
jgi:predicted permease